MNASQTRSADCRRRPDRTDACAVAHPPRRPGAHLRQGCRPGRNLARAGCPGPHAGVPPPDRHRRRRARRRRQGRTSSPCVRRLASPPGFRSAISAQGVTPYSFAFALPQDIHERMLIDHLERRASGSSADTELVAFVEDDGRRHRHLAKEGVERDRPRAYLVGCDGAHSAVRHGLNIGFPGGTYEQSFYVADVEGEAPSPQRHGHRRSAPMASPSSCRSGNPVRCG